MKIESFNTLDEMMASLQRNEAAAMARLTPLQRVLLPLREFYWMRPAPQYECVIFGYYNLDDMIALEKSLTPEDEMDWHPGWVVSTTDKNLVRGYKSGRAYSVIEPDGELGDTHVSTMWPITKESFEQAKAMRWDVLGKVEMGTPLYDDFVAMENEIRAMARAQS